MLHHGQVQPPPQRQPERCSNSVERMAGYFRHTQIPNQPNTRQGQRDAPVHPKPHHVLLPRGETDR